jgi:hypothetical protein
MTSFTMHKTAAVNIARALRTNKFNLNWTILDIFQRSLAALEWRAGCQKDKRRWYPAHNKEKKTTNAQVSKDLLEVFLQLKPVKDAWKMLQTTIDTNT